MTDRPSSGSRSVRIGGDVSRSNIVVGDHSTATYHEGGDAPGSDVDVRAELAAIREVLASLEAPERERAKIDHALDEAEADAAEAEPDRDEVGDALDRAVKYASKTAGFADAIDRLRPHLKNVAGWLGTYGPHLARALGFGG